MIKNDRQYKITTTKLVALERTLADLRQKRNIGQGLHPRLKTAQEATLKTVIADLKAELSEYDRVR